MRITGFQQRIVAGCRAQPFVVSARGASHPKSTTIETTQSCRSVCGEGIVPPLGWGIQMRLLLRWHLHMVLLCVLSFSLASGLSVQLPKDVLGYKVPPSAQTWVDATISDLGLQAQNSSMTVERGITASNLTLATGMTKARRAEQ